MEQGEATGIGTITYPDGTTYRGEVHNLKPDGYGQKTDLEGLSYTGFFEDGKRSGYGNLYKFDQLIYSGHWRKNHKHGVGCLYSDNVREGYKEFGVWSNDKFTTEFPEDTVQAKFDDMSLYIRKTIRRAERVLRKIQLLLSRDPSVADKKKPSQIQETGHGLLKLLALPQQAAKKILLSTLLANATDIMEVKPHFFKHSLVALRERVGAFNYLEYSVKNTEPLMFQDWKEVSDGEYFKGEMNQSMQPSGKGVLATSDRIYEGYWINGEKCGLGREIEAGGAIYEGYWRSGMKSGYGVYNKNEEERYAGDWKEDRPNGEGIQSLGDYRYEGSFVNGKKDGRGKETCSDDSTYFGDFENDLRHGYGVLIEPSGRKYAGAWEVGEILGRGVEVEANGNSYCGGFKGGRRVDAGLLYDGKKLVRTFNRGR